MIPEFEEYASVAQPDRARGFEPRGRGFEPLRSHHKSTMVNLWCFCCTTNRRFADDAVS